MRWDELHLRFSAKFQTNRFSHFFLLEGRQSEWNWHIHTHTQTNLSSLCPRDKHHNIRHYPWQSTPVSLFAVLCFVFFLLLQKRMFWSPEKVSGKCVASTVMTKKMRTPKFFYFFYFFLFLFFFSRLSDFNIEKKKCNPPFTGQTIVLCPIHQAIKQPPARARTVFRLVQTNWFTSCFKPYLQLPSGWH